MKYFKKILYAVFILVICSCDAEKDDSGLGIKKSAFKIFLAGDSTCATKTENARPETGWGEMLGQYFDTYVIVDNHAVNGQSTKSFRTAGMWKAILDNIKEGDWVFVQFGHNDQKLTDPKVGTEVPEFISNLELYIDEAVSKGANVILLTPIARRSFSGNDVTNTHGEYPDAVKTAARNKNIPLIDMTSKTSKLVASYGSEGSKDLYMWVSKADYPHLSADKKDNTHLAPLGATKVAELIVEGIREQKIKGLYEYLK